MMMRLGVGAPRKASMAAATPPMWTFMCAFSIRRSIAALSMTSATREVSQKAWIEMRGTCAIWGASPAAPI